MTQPTAGTTPTMKDVLEYWYTDLTLEEIAEKLGITLSRLYSLRTRYKLPQRDRIQTTDREENNPSQAEIAEAARKIRASWTPAQEALRLVNKQVARPWTPRRFTYNSGNGLFKPLD